MVILLTAGCSNSQPLVEITAIPSPIQLTYYLTRTVTPVLTGTPAPVQALPSPTPTLQIHVVKKDELGSEIALRYGVTIAMLQAANQGVDLNFLKEGSSLVIPARSTTPSPILFTPTPIILETGQTYCYPSADQKAWCLVNIKNTLSKPVYYLTGEFILDTGGYITARQVAGLVDVLPSGAQIPLIVRINDPVGYPYQIRFDLKTAFGAENPAVRSLQITGQQVEMDPRGLWARVTGTILGDSAKVQQAAVILSGYQNDLPAGIRRLEFAQGIEPNQSLPFDITVYTTGPLINHIEILAEGK